MQKTIYEMINLAIEEIKTNKEKFSMNKTRDYFSTSEIRKQEQDTQEQNAQVVKKLKENLLNFKQDLMQEAYEREIRESQKSDTEVSNIMGMLSLTAQTLDGQEINDLYKEHYHVPLIKRSIEGVAKTRALYLDEVVTKAQEASEVFNRTVREYTQSISPKEINENLEVIGAILTLTKGD